MYKITVFSLPSKNDELSVRKIEKTDTIMISGCSLAFEQACEQVCQKSGFIN